MYSVHISPTTGEGLYIFPPQQCTVYIFPPQQETLPVYESWGNFQLWSRRGEVVTPFSEFYCYIDNSKCQKPNQFNQNVYHDGTNLSDSLSPLRFFCHCHFPGMVGSLVWKRLAKSLALRIRNTPSLTVVKPGISFRPLWISICCRNHLGLERILLEMWDFTWQERVLYFICNVGF